ncbi:unnamed protein product, partial [Vitis vinifera]|uniref:Uncharacterized protein n=1 Tax=Vitis vinifera TaxID=29760 RepID=D7TF91_VITVI
MLGMRCNTCFIAQRWISHVSPHGGYRQSWANHVLPPLSTFVLDVDTSKSVVLTGNQAPVLPLAKSTGA